MPLMPPAQYDHPPAMQVIEQIWTSDRVNEQCHALAARLPVPRLGTWVYNGCEMTRLVDGKVVCYIWRIDDASVRRHEIAHCNGWKHE